MKDKYEEEKPRALKRIYKRNEEDHDVSGCRQRHAILGSGVLHEISNRDKQNEDGSSKTQREVSEQS